jgi:hypothetical protein
MISQEDARQLRRTVREVKNSVPRRIYRRNPRSAGGGSGATAIRRAYVAVDPTTIDNVACYLDSPPDEGETKETVTVYFNIISPLGRRQLTHAVPRLTVGEYVFVMQINATWCCIQSFMDSGTC